MRGGRSYVHPETRIDFLETLHTVDDIILVWNGNLNFLDRFISSLSNNQRGISLSHEASADNIHFLDLNILDVNGQIITTTFLKPPIIMSLFPEILTNPPLGFSLSPKVFAGIV